MRGEELRIRPASAADVPGVIRLERAIGRAPHWPAEVYVEVVGCRERCFLVAELGGELVGFAVAAVAGGEGELETIAVDGALQGRGTGGALLARALEWARDAGAEAVWLEVRAGSAGARRLYGRAGFVEVGVRPRYYADPVEDAVIMRWKGGSRG